MVGILRNKEGHGYVFVGVIVIAIMLLFSGIYEYCRVISIVKNSEKIIAQKLDAYITDYSIEHYEVFQMGKAYAATFSRDGFINGAYRKLGTTEGGSMILQTDYSDNAQGIKLENIRLSAMSGDQIGIIAKIKVIIPVGILGSNQKYEIETEVKSRVVPMAW